MIGDITITSVRPRVARRTLTACLAAVAVAAAGCTDHAAVDPTPLARASLAIAPTFARVPGAAVTLGKVTALLIAPNGDTAVASSAFANGEAQLAFEVPIKEDKGTFTLELQAADQSGTPIYQSRGEYILQRGDNEELRPELAPFGMVVINDFNLFTNAYVDPDSQPTANARFLRNIIQWPIVGQRPAARNLLLFYGHGSRCNNTGSETPSEECVVDQFSALAAILKASNGQIQSMADQYNATNQTTTIARIDSIPASVGTVFLMAPTINFADAEVNVLKQFIGRGGRLVYLGEYESYYGVGMEVENSLLSRMSATLRDGGGEYACNVGPLSGGDILSSSLTDGVTEIAFGCGAALTLGTADIPLFQVFDGNTNRTLGAIAAVNLTPTVTGGRNVIPAITGASRPVNPHRRGDGSPF